MTDTMNAMVGAGDMRDGADRGRSQEQGGDRRPRGEKGVVSLTAPYRAHGEQALRAARPNADDLHKEMRPAPLMERLYRHLPNRP